MPGIYRKISCAYWQGELAEALRGDAVAHTVAFYLMTCPSTNQIGCYRLALATLSDDVGYASETCLEAVATLQEAGFCVFDQRFRMVFVTEMARHEWGEVPNPKRNEVVGLKNSLPMLLSVCPKSFVWSHFWDRYGEPWAEILEGIERPSGADSERVPNASRTRPRPGSGSGSGSGSGFSPPNPPAKRPAPKKRRSGRKIPAVRIPEELRQIGIDSGAFAERVRTCKVRKEAEAWQKELDRLAPLVEEVGEDVVLEVWDDAVASGWQGCTPAFVRERSAKGRPRQGKRSAEPPLSGLSYDPADYGAPVIDIPARLRALANALPDAFANFSGKIATLSGNGDAEKTEAELEKLDRAMLKAAAEGLDDETRQALAAQVDAAMAKLDKRLDEEVKKKNRRRFKERALREHLGLPELSLFSREATT